MPASEQEPHHLVFPSDLSVNVTNLPHLQAALTSGRGPRIIWFGDSTGADSYLGVYDWLTNTTVAGVQPGVYIGWSISYPTYYLDPPFYTEPSYFWGPGQSVAVYPGSNIFYSAGTAGANGLLGNRLQIWYYSSAANGVATVQISHNASSWTTIGTIDETTGAPDGTLQCTNFVS